jgi:hypothetical protein
MGQQEHRSIVNTLARLEGFPYVRFLLCQLRIAFPIIDRQRLRYSILMGNWSDTPLQNRRKLELIILTGGPQDRLAEIPLRRLVLFYEGVTAGHPPSNLRDLFGVFLLIS